MLNKKINNFICNYLSEYQIQKKHVERVLSAKEITNNKKGPYKPKFLQLKLSRHQIEEEKNEKIREGNKLLFVKIINAEIKPSQYSRIYEPKKCPSFDKNAKLFKRVKEEIKNYQENMRFYNKIEKVKSFYDNKNLSQRNKDIDKNIKKLHKSILELQPSLLFSSPQDNKQNRKYKHLTNYLFKKRCNSCLTRGSSKNIVNDKVNLTNTKEKEKSKNEKENNPSLSNDSRIKKFFSMNDLNERSNKDNKENNKIIEKNLENMKENIDKIRSKENKNKEMEKNGEKGNAMNKKKLSLGKNKENIIEENLKEKEKPKNKKINFGLKRSGSEINIFK